ncbi:MAG TPA: bifunctional adenosylcobinamide kinase/adenosylcobinamide-phosphate guanylyltransferase [Bacillales bacterium]|nr:bifunctional adenosylcobinamide kinase/adenosylcobinamide-phosphate guanylyltransferase [Bacillales bacterium]
MHFITGGAYNGKSVWAKEFYQLNNQDCRWISAYKYENFPDDLSKYHEKFIVLEGVEQWILKMIEDNASCEHREKGRKIIQAWTNWETLDRHLVVIGTDISKGIVPIEPIDRIWRDTTGWFYQDLVAKCDRFDLIWYGIAKQLK